MLNTVRTTSLDPSLYPDPQQNFTGLLSAETHHPSKFLGNAFGSFFESCSQTNQPINKRMEAGESIISLAGWIK